MIGVIGAFNHSIGHRVKALQGRDWVSGEKAGICVEEGYLGVAGDCFYRKEGIIGGCEIERPSKANHGITHITMCPFLYISGHGRPEVA